MTQVGCLACKKEFYAKPSWVRKGWGKYCSKTCQFEDQKTGLIVKCSVCGKDCYKSVKALNASNSGKYFCSKSCQTIWRNKLYAGPSHSQWRGGERVYKSILLKSGLEQLCRRCKIDDKRVLAVHHLDRNRKNNSLNNLIWLCHNCHFLLHHNKQEEDNLMVAMV